MSKLHRWFAPLLLAAVLPACAARYSVAGRDPALGADADIVVSKTKSGNYFVEIGIKNIAPPDRLDSEATAYVVWFQPAEQAAIKAGMLSYDPKDRDGFIEATTPHREFTVLVTLETGPDVGVPADKAIITQAVRARK